MIGSHVFTALAMAAALSAPGYAFGQASLSLAESRSNVTVYAGGLDVTKGFENRNYAGIFYNQYFGSVGVHADIVGIRREEDSGFATVGMSWDAAKGVRPKVMIGTSTSNLDIHPEVYVSAQAQIRPTADTRTIVTPSITYRKFRTGAEEVIPGVDAVYYFSIPADTTGYYVAQAGANVVLGEADDTGYSVGMGLQTVRANGLSFGAYVEAGSLAYDSLIGEGVQTDFYSVRPALGLRFTPETEVFFRGEYTHTDFYEASGLLVGFKLTF